MKISDKRNKNKMKNANKSKIDKIESKLYSTEHGPYKVVSFINLGGCMKKIQDDLLNNQSRNLFFYKNKKMNFLFQDTQSLNDYETSYVTRTSDIVVFVVNSKEIDQKKTLLVKRHLPPCLFVILDKKFLKSTKKFVSDQIPDQKIIEYNVLLDFLCLTKSNSTNICSRPYMVPTVVNYDNEFVIVKGFMKKGPASNKIIINGKYEGEIVQIEGEKIYQEKLGMSDDEISKFTIVRDFNEQEMEIEDYGDEYNDEENNDEENNDEEYNDEEYNDEENNDEENNDEENNDEENSLDSADDGMSVEEEYPSMITKYAEYRGIRNITTCEFNTDKYPDYYKNLLFFQDFKHVQKFITNRKSITADNEMLEIKIKLSQPITDNIFILFSCYDFEEYNTILNFEYSNSSNLQTGQKIYVDYGHKLIEVIPTVTKNAIQNLYKREEGLENGVISFIGPIIFNISKVLIFQENLLKEVSIETFKCVGVNVGIKERKLYDEVVLQGLPIKIYKRSCIIKRMFYTKEEVLYYKNIRLHTKNGRSSGYIKKPLGVHGSFRAYFSHPIASNDKILMSLYKRAFLDDYTK